jgi:glycosidase
MKKIICATCLLICTTGYTAHAQVLPAANWWNDAVFYEVFVRSFYDANADGKGDLQGLISKLDYLNDGDPNTQTDLGVNALWLMPVNESPSYHGYDVTNYYKVEPDYGTTQDFKNLITQAHNRGIKVIIDFVINHSSSQHNWFVQSQNNNANYQNFYRWSANNPGTTSPWGSQCWHQNSNGKYYYGIFWSGMPDLNYAHPPVKDSIFNAASYWLNTMGVDGFRLDAVRYIFENGNIVAEQPQTYSFLQDFSAHCKNQKPTAMNVGEAWTSSNYVVSYVTNNRLDYCFDFDLATAMTNAIKNQNPAPVANQMNFLKSYFPFLQYGTFLTNHDQNRIMTELGNSTTKMKSAAALYLTLPGVPYLYYGEEIGMIGSGIDENKRTPMQWNANANAGFTTSSPWRNPNTDYTTKNVNAQLTDPNSLWRCYQKLIKIRTDEPILRRGNYTTLNCSNTGVYAFWRMLDGNAVLVLHNLKNQNATNFNVGLWGLPVQVGVFNVNDLVSGNISTLAIDSNFQIKNLDVPANSTKILKFVNVVSANEPTNALQKIQAQVWDNVLNITNIQATEVATIQIFDLNGKRIALQNQTPTTTDHTLQISIKHLPAALYFVEITDKNNQKTTLKFIKNK